MTLSLKRDIATVRDIRQKVEAALSKEVIAFRARGVVDEQLRRLEHLETDLRLAEEAANER